MYSTHGFDKPFLEQAALGKHEVVYSETLLEETTAHLAEGFDAIALFTSDNASNKTLEHLQKVGIRYVALRSVGYDHIDITKSKELDIKVANVPTYSPYAIEE